MQGDGASKISRERLVAQLAESLVARAEALSREAADLADVLERASSRLGVEAPGGGSKLDADTAPKPEASHEPEAARAPTPPVVPARGAAREAARGGPLAQEALESLQEGV